MDGLIELAIAVGRLEARIDALEKRSYTVDRTPAPEIKASFGDESHEMTPDKRLQEGIDNIMGYQWPPAGEG